MIFKILRNFFLVLGIFCAGIIFAVNFADLVGTNPQFEPEGWKSIVAVGVAIYCGIMLSSKENEDA